MKFSDLPALGVSFVTHVLILAILFLIKLTVDDHNVQLDLETSFEDYERQQEEITRELELDTTVAETFNTQPGGVVTGEIGASTAPVVTQTKVEQAETLEEPTIEVSLSEVTLPSDDILGKDFGESEVTGEVGAAVDGYGAAMSRITQELIRLMRKEKLLCVWLFDESGSMKDDQKEIAENFEKVYQELGLITKKDEQLKKKLKDEPILSVIRSFGKARNELTKAPTSNYDEIVSSIGKIPVDQTGEENMLGAISATVEDYIGLARRQDRRLVLIIVSDESGDDGDAEGPLETTVAKLKQARVPCYFMGRESMFGYKIARMIWDDPETNIRYWRPVRRGPETPAVECLQWDGLHERWDNQNAGFGPYGQVRLARETGGIFFILPNEEETLAGPAEITRRKYAFLDMKEYLPNLDSYREYVEDRDRHNFRKILHDVIQRLNPDNDRDLSIREDWYPLELGEFMRVGQQEMNKAAKAMGLTETALKMLDNIRPLRDTEPSERWRANYDLAYAQLKTFRIRLFQFMLAMDDHAANDPKPVKEKTNRWDINRNTKMFVPDEDQYKRLASAFKLKMTREEYLAEIEATQKEATLLLRDVGMKHPGTPWAVRAQQEISRGFGMHFVESFWDPRRKPADQLPNL
ncbi:MAG TPA: vWA domain-containing protein [Planctomycetaceae bacterium]|nr:vWA domain-containing protein [Planctomycetaceae bacterium]